MRALSKQYMNDLQTGYLNPIIDMVREDKDLDFQIREDYFNIYFKGNSLLCLTKKRGGVYVPSIHGKFTNGLAVPKSFAKINDVQAFLALVPDIKARIIKHGEDSLEIEYEQLIIRANNQELRNKSEYFIVDRQYARPKDRFDLTGIYWPSKGRKRGDTVDLCLMEVKYALNPDIKQLHMQLDRYYISIASNIVSFASEAETMLKQKCDLGVINYKPINALKSLSIAKNIANVQFIIVLVDYNPNSSLFTAVKSNIRNLSFKGQIRLFDCGLAMWATKVPII